MLNSGNIPALDRLQGTAPSSPALFQGEFEIEGWNVLVLQGPAELLDGVEYISFTGDFGFRYSYTLPSREGIGDHIANTRKLFSHFNTNILNLEFILPGIGSPREIDRIAEFEAFSSRQDDGRSCGAAGGRPDNPGGNAKWYLYLESIMMEVIQKTPFEVVSLANNHALDYGPMGLDYNEHRLRSAGATCYGTTNKPAARLSRITGEVIVYSMTDLVDQQDVDRLVAKLDEANIAEAKTRIRASDFGIAFMHVTANRSVYPSPYELRLVDNLVDAGFKLIVCTGSHWPKGYARRRGIPVFWGTGNYLFPFTRDLPERQGMHVVAGLRQGKLVQLFTIPFSNTFETGSSGPLTGTDLLNFKKAFLDRSNYSRLKFYKDHRNLHELKMRIREIKSFDMKQFGEHLHASDALVLLFNLPAILKKPKLGLMVAASIILGWILCTFWGILFSH